jgi:hypothetical protein
VLKWNVYLSVLNRVWTSRNFAGARSRNMACRLQCIVCVSLLMPIIPLLTRQSQIIISSSTLCQLGNLTTISRLHLTSRFCCSSRARSAFTPAVLLVCSCASLSKSMFPLLHQWLQQFKDSLFLNLNESWEEKKREGKLIFTFFLHYVQFMVERSYGEFAEKVREFSIVGFSWEKNGRNTWRDSREFREDRLGDPTICHNGEGVRIGLLYATTRHPQRHFLLP